MSSDSVTYGHLTVPIDDSSESRDALPLALSIARRCAATIELVHVVVVPQVVSHDMTAPALFDPAEVPKRRDGAKAVLDKIATDIAPAASVSISTTVLEGSDVDDALARHMSTSGTDLVVMTTHDRSRLGRLLFGSTAESTARHAHVPVILARAGTKQTAALPFQHILVPLDGSGFAEQVLSHALALAKLTDARVTLVSVVAPIVAIASGSLGPPAVMTLPPSIDGAESTLLSEMVERVRAWLIARGTRAEATVLTDGQPGRAIARLADEQGVDLIAMTTHGRGALGRLLAGSVAESVLHATRVPVLLYRPSKV